MTIARAGAVPPLVELLRHGDAAGKQAAACALQTLACNDDNKVQIAASGAVPALVAVLASTGEDRRGAREAAGDHLRGQRRQRGGVRMGERVAVVAAALEH